MRTRCALYARYSSDNQRDASIEDQLRICTARAEREGWDVVDTFADAAISGATTRRPGFQSLVESMRSGKVDIVLAESLDRFSRDLEHVAAFHKQAQFSRVAIITLSEGEISDLHVGLKGTMGALYLKDLAAKTHRGQEGRVRKGFGCGRVPFGYRAIRRLDAAGEPERGLREIDPVAASVVRRIFRDYVEGTSPMAIARALNAEGVASPSGGDWFPSTIRGRPGRDDGILRNPIYVGRMVWNRHAHPRDPLSGRKTIRRNAPEALVEVAVPEQRIIDDGLWISAQKRLASEATPKDEGGIGAFWDRRRPRHLLTGKVFCGLCGRPFSVMGRDYLGCHAARCDAGCTNRRRVRRPRLEARVLEALGKQLMRPELVEAFCDAVIEEWNRLTAQVLDEAGGRRRELQGIERKLAHVIDAISDGLKSPELARKLSELEAQRAELLANLDDRPRAAPALPRDLARVYAARVGALRQAIGAEGGTEVLEAMRALVDRIIVSPGQGPGDPPDIELVGHLMAMLKAGGAQLDRGDNVAIGVITAMSSGSAKAGKGEVLLPRALPFPVTHLPLAPPAAPH